ncbi:MAG: CinA family protein [bacterium]|nr:CinA family protein [bacterium]
MGEMFEGYEKLPKDTIKLFLDAKQTCAVAESCTGGLISHLLTQIPGSSKVFMGSLVAYSNDFKIKLLKVSPDTIARHSTESPQVTKEMAINMRLMTGAHVACATNGIAGPGPGHNLAIPIGQVFIALSSEHTVECHQFQFFGRREEIKLKASLQAITLLNDYVKNIHVK